ncbi:MAG TPA: hypothetical protein VNC84_00145 [Gammaproteobacteria bacterium]|jgi:hypothetical protein|nr:hypothetical protein [Gammaproteobacteria bacterium]
MSLDREPSHLFEELIKSRDKTNTFEAFSTDEKASVVIHTVKNIVASQEKHLTTNQKLVGLLCLDHALSSPKMVKDAFPNPLDFTDFVMKCVAVRPSQMKSIIEHVFSHPELHDHLFPIPFHLITFALEDIAKKSSNSMPLILNNFLLPSPIHNRLSPTSKDFRELLRECLSEIPQSDIRPFLDRIVSDSVVFESMIKDEKYWQAFREEVLLGGFIEKDSPLHHIISTFVSREEAKGAIKKNTPSSPSSERSVQGRLFQGTAPNSTERKHSDTGDKKPPFKRKE